MRIEDRFDNEFAENYDRGIRVAAPGYEALHDMAHSLLRLELEERARLLVVGAGTGMEIAGMGAEEPGWSFTGVDPSADMISVARRRLAPGGLAQRTDLRVGYTRDLPPTEPYDGATAMLVMHFLPDDGQKLEFLQSISARLRTGAPLILADLHGDENSTRFSRFLAAWRLRQLASGMEEKDAEEMFRGLRSVVRFVPEERIIALLHEAGFEDVERFYGAMLFGAWLARKA